MRRKPRAFLWDVREAAANVERFTAAIEYEQFANDALVRSAVER